MISIPSSVPPPSSSIWSRSSKLERSLGTENCASTSCATTETGGDGTYFAEMARHCQWTDVRQVVLRVGATAEQGFGESASRTTLTPRIQGDFPGKGRGRSLPSERVLKVRGRIRERRCSFPEAVEATYCRRPLERKSEAYQRRTNYLLFLARPH